MDMKQGYITVSVSHESAEAQKAREELRQVAYSDDELGYLNMRQRRICRYTQQEPCNVAVKGMQTLKGSIVLPCHLPDWQANDIFHPHNDLLSWF